MFIDYITLMLTNMAAGLCVLAGFLLWGLQPANSRNWWPAFGIVGGVALATGLAMTCTWPVSLEKLRFANMAFGEMTVLFGALFLGAAASLAGRLSMGPLAIYAAVAAVVAAVVGVGIGRLGITQAPMLTSAGYLLTAVGGFLASLCAAFRPQSLLPRLANAILLLAAAGIWMLIAVNSYWGHLAHLSE
jgi:putative membrane protein